MNVTNSTTFDALNGLAEGSKTFMQQVKDTVPYEVWFCAAIALFIVYLFTRGGNQAYSSIWKVGLYVAIISVVLWFLLTR